MNIYYYAIMHKNDTNLLNKIQGQLITNFYQLRWNRMIFRYNIGILGIILL